KGEDLSALLNLGSSFTDVPGGTAHWTFAGNANYNSAAGDVAITITKANQTITFNSLTGKTLGDAPFAVLGSATSGLPLSFTTTPSVCTSSGSDGSTITLVIAGTCTVRASQGGNGDYNAAVNVDQSFTVVARQTTASISAPPVTYGSNATVTVTVSSPSGVPAGSVTLTVDGGAGVTQTLNGSGIATFTLTNPTAGDHSLSASYAGAGWYSSSSATGSQHVDPKALVGSFTVLSPKVYDGTTSATILTRTLNPGGVVGTDSVSYTGGTATFDNKNVGTNKTVTGTGFSLSGPNAGNYT